MVIERPERATIFQRAEALTNLVAARETQLIADQWVVKRVQEARALGCSWSEVAEVFGISKSAAFQRYAHLPPVGWIERAR